MAPVDPHLVNAFYRALMFLKARIEHDGWGWTSNYLREHVRAAYGLRFSNSKSPKILRALMKQHPEFAKLVKIKPLKTQAALLFDDPDPPPKRKQ
jgi:hypothetical protein